jgi:predicted nucleotidyltransferase
MKNSVPMNELQRHVLEEIDAFAAMYPAIKALYLFGSIARGDEWPDSDIDIAIEWAAGYRTEPELMISYANFQPEGLKWGDRIAAKFGRPVSFIRHSIYHLDDAAWPAILEAARVPLAVIGKAIMVWTAPKP